MTFFFKITHEKYFFKEALNSEYFLPRQKLKKVERYSANNQ